MDNTNLALADMLLTEICSLRCDLIAVTGTEDELEIRKQLQFTIGQLNEVYADNSNIHNSNQ